MTDNGNNEGATWPMPKFSFEVDLGNELIGVAFQEVSGLDVEDQIIEYRKSDSPDFVTAKMPGMVKYGNITMKRGVFVNDNTFWDWYDQITTNTIDRGTVLIKLVDENGDITMLWSLENAWPTKITSADLQSDSNEVAVETIELSYQNLKVHDKAL